MSQDDAPKRVRLSSPRNPHTTPPNLPGVEHIRSSHPAKYPQVGAPPAASACVRGARTRGGRPVSGSRGGLAGTG